MKLFLAAIALALILLPACTGPVTPDTVLDLSGIIAIHNDTATEYFIIATVSSGTISGLILSNSATVISVASAVTYDWTADWENSVAGESQPLDVKVYSDDTASGPVIRSRTIDVFDGTTTTYELTDIPVI